MAANKPAANKVIRELIEKFPKQSKANIGKIAFQKYPHLFDSAELARNCVRYVTDSMGSKSRKKVKETMSLSPELPASNCKEREFIKLPAIANNILWLSDLHIPNQDNIAITAAIEYGVQKEVNCIVLGGDIMDNTPFTSHDAPPPGLDDVRTWFEYTEQFLVYLRSKFPSAHIVWLEGNHDNWVMRYLMKKAPILFNDEYYHLPQRLNLKKYNIHFYKEHIVLKAGKLGMHHGHHFVKGIISPVNPARGLFMRAKGNFIIGHVHQPSSHPEADIYGNQIGCWSVGCLTTLAPLYDPMNTKHSKGFAHIEIQANGNFTVNNKKFVNGQIFSA